MIQRILVPIGARPPVPADAVTQRRRPTTMDERTLVPAMLPIVPLNGQSTIPTNLPLESIAARVVVPRDVNREAYGVHEDLSTPLQPTDLDERITVPAGAAPPSVIEPMTILPSPDLVEPDIVRHFAGHTPRFGRLARFLDRNLNRPRHPYFHLRMETLVPSPGFDRISNSCESRFAPLRPSPIPLPVE